MWPKAFAQLVELLPHVTRLVPMADLFFATKTSSEKANEAALRTLTTEVRGDLGKVTAAHDGLYRHLQTLSGDVAEIVAEVGGSRAALELYGERTAALERQIGVVIRWVRGIAVVLVLVLAGVAAILVRLLTGVS